MASDLPQHVVVIGAGMAGLAAAEAVLDAGSGPPARVTIVEAADRVGGVIESTRHGSTRQDGWLVERSADNFLAVRPEGVRLVERLGLAGELIGVDPAVRKALVWDGGRTVPVPAGFRLLAPGRVGGVLSTPLLSVAGRLRLLAERFVPPRPAAVDDESLESFAVRRLGREAFDRLVQPLAAGIWTADPARLSMAAACPEFFEMERRDGSLWAGERRRARAAAGGAAGNTIAGGPAAPGIAVGARYGQFLTLRDGLDTLPRRLADRLANLGAARIQATATAVERLAGGGWRVMLAGTGDAATPHDVLAADAVILAVPAPAAARLLSDHDAALAAELGGIEYAGSVVVSLGFRRSDVAHPLDAAGLVVPRSSGRRLLAVSFSSRKFPGRAPADAVLLRSFVGGALDPEAMDLDDDALVALVRRELADVIGAAGTPRLVQVDRWRGAMPQYTVGHVARVARIAALVGRHPGLALAGAAYEGVGIPQVIGSGQAAAARIRETRAAPSSTRG